MRRRIGLVLGGGLVALLTWSLWPRTIADPVVRGKPLSAWLDERRQPAPVGPIALSPRAIGAVRELGPDAVPTLLAWIQQPDSAITRGSQALGRLVHLPIGLPDHGDERARGALGLRALGSAARSAWPALVAQVLRSDDSVLSRDALFTLLDADAEVARQFVPAATSDPSRDVRFQAMFALASLPRAADTVGWPTLERLRADPDPAIVAQAHQCLTYLNIMLNLAAQNLKHPDADIRLRSVRAIEGHGAHAHRNLPDLEALADDPDPTVRAAVAEAIERVKSPPP